MKLTEFLLAEMDREVDVRAALWSRFRKANTTGSHTRSL